MVIVFDHTCTFIDLIVKIQRLVLGRFEKFYSDREGQMIEGEKRLDNEIFILSLPNIK